MGRGRQRAKQRKVARDLKYFSPDTDYAALERELTGHKNDVSGKYADNAEDDYDVFAEYAAKYGVDDEDDDLDTEA